MSARELEYVLVGGGLQNALIALALLDRPNPPTIALVERGAALGGNHTWCFHEDDLPAALSQAVAPMIAARWDGHDVMFPTLRRTISARYAAVTSTLLDEVVRRRLAETPGCELLLGRSAAHIERDSVELDGGDTIRARVVIDARGPVDSTDGCGFQKFLGLELALARQHGISRPIVMDATVAQQDGFRFMYVLPLAGDRLLVEDTTFSSTPALDRSLLRQRVLGYVASRGLGPAEIIREEEGVLPMPWRSSTLPRVAGGGPLAAGYRGGWFHPATGYSFPVAARLAALCAQLPAERLIGPELERLAADVRGQARYCRQLNRLLFRWCAPRERWQVLERFYRLPEQTIRRFYALDLTRVDQARILFGRPPRGLSVRTRLGRPARAGVSA